MKEYFDEVFETGFCNPDRRNGNVYGSDRILRGR